MQSGCSSSWIRAHLILLELFRCYAMSADAEDIIPAGRGLRVPRVTKLYYITTRGAGLPATVT